MSLYDDNLEPKNEQEQDYLGLDTRLIVTVIIPVIETCRQLKLQFSGIAP
jgi:hypothetical protein